MKAVVYIGPWQVHVEDVADYRRVARLGLGCLASTGGTREPITSV
jgi:hypothetical protein